MPSHELAVKETAAERLPSEDVVVSAPMSFHGSAVRIWKLTQREPEAAWTALEVALIAVAWTVVVLWYLTFWFWLVPYRLIRRSQRKRRLEDARQRELVTAIREVQ